MAPDRRLSRLRFPFVILASFVAAASPALAAPKSEGKPTTKAAVKAKKAAKTSKPAQAGVSAAKATPLPRARPRAISAIAGKDAVKDAASPRSLDPQPAAQSAAYPQAVVASPSPPRPAPMRATTVASATGSFALASAPTETTSSSDIAAVKQAVALARRGRAGAATELQASISDPLARKLVEWAILRADDNEASFARYNAFLAANPTWPSAGMFRKRAEAMLWAENADAGKALAFFGRTQPLTAKGRFALARVLLAQGDRAGAQAQVSAAWTEPFSRELESEAREAFGGLITRADDKARMDRRLYAEELDAAQRAAARVGGAEVAAIVRARNAVNDKADNAKALLEAVPASARSDVGYMFSRIQWLRRDEQYEEAARLMLAAPNELGAAHDADEWWVERRLIARKLIELGQPKAAYLVCRNAERPAKENYQVEHEFMAGWIALRFLHEPNLAAQHFARIPALGVENPIALARAGYWQGRAAEAAGRRQEARAFYETAARYSTAYYGQLARARLGLGEIALRSPPALTPERRAAVARAEVVRAADILYAIGEPNLVLPFVADLPDRSPDASALAAVAELTAKHNDARAMLLLGKSALARGLPLDHHAFPTIGLPRYNAIGPEVEPAIVYAIARQESAFNPRTVSSAKAMGLMQVTPAAGRFIAKTYGVKYDQKRLLNDNVYNVQMGAAELGGNLEAYRGSYILAFAAYNAGRGRVKEWIERFGDPRDPNIDPIDWVERIPFSETRNYVQRIMENVQAYRVRFGRGAKLHIEADIRRGSASVN